MMPTLIAVAFTYFEDEKKSTNELILNRLQSVKNGSHRYVVDEEMTLYKL